MQLIDNASEGQLTAQLYLHIHTYIHTYIQNLYFKSYTERLLASCV